MIKSLTSFDQSEFLGGMVVNVKFAKNSLEGDGIKKFVSLLRAFIARGGIEMQVNAVDRATLIDAKENPELHSDLTVRIGGYSDYFVRLSETLQNEIIDRTEY
jgi:formate C-acetyltransferase